MLLEVFYLILFFTSYYKYSFPLKAENPMCTSTIAYQTLYYGAPHIYLCIKFWRAKIM